MELPRTLDDLPTPALLVERDRLEVNLQAMAETARASGVRLRPHIKTHKSLELARRQLEGGAAGLTTAKVSEAAPFAQAIAAGELPVADLLVAYPLIGRKASELRALAEQTGAIMATVADSEEGIGDLSEAWADAPAPLSVLLKVDTGLHRVGIPVGDAERALTLARAIQAAPGLRFGGLLTHGGHVYAAASPREVEHIGVQEGERMVALAEELRSRGLEVAEVSVGSTPTAPHAAAVRGVTEIRPGNYVFNDAKQVSLGVVPLQRCALTVWTTVVSRPEPGRAVCDAGSKVFSCDHVVLEKGKREHGVVLKDPTTLEAGPGIHLAALSEEHGRLKLKPSCSLRIGERLRIVPAHACTTVNLAEHLWLVDGEKVLERWPVTARGCSL
jgi:D-serine deaminase-like pyridoxal phosphate-dependent protein